ncbi:putative ribonuclease H-like domain-containing protein [Tanacetum coccineum]
MYSVDMKNIVPKESLTCLVAKTTLDESMLWHRRLGHVNFKTINKLVKENLVRGLPTKRFENDQTCVAFLKGKQYKASYKSKIQNSITQPIFMLHMDLFGSTFVSSLMNKKYCLVVTDDYSRFTWVFFLASKDETSSILKSFITEIENLVDKKVNIIRCDNGTEFKNKVKMEFSVARTPKQNGVAERRNRTLIKAARTIKAFRVYNIRTRKVEENLHIRFLEDKPIIAGTNSNDFVGTEESISAGHSSKETRSSQDCILMPLWKDGSLFDSFSKNASNDEPQPSSDTGKKDDDGVYKNKKDKIGIVIRNKARLVAQGYTQEEGIDYDEVFAPVARIEVIRRFLAYASFKEFVVYQMDMKSAFLYGKIKEKVYVYQPLGFKDPEFPDKVSKVKNALYGLHQAPRSWYETLSTYLLDNGFQRGQIDKTLFIKRIKSDILLVQVYVDDIIFGLTKMELCTEFEKLMHKKFQMSSMGELTFFLGLQVTQKDDGIFISQDKYVDEILKKFGFLTMKTTSTPMETSKPLLKDAEAEDVDVHLYRSMIGSLMYLTASRPDIMFDVCACARFQVTPKVSHLYAVKKIFRYLKGQPKLGLWYPKDSPFNLEAYTDSGYPGASLDRKSTTGSCQFLRSRLISWQCKKQTIVANSTTEAEYIVASSCCRQVLWIQNQLLDYGYNFMNTKIFIGNESTICIVKNPVFYSKTKHIEIRHHFIWDSYEKKLIQMIKIHTDHNLADLLTKAFDVRRFQYLIATNKTVIKEWEDIMERAFTTASSLEAEQDSGNINRTQSIATPNESFPHKDGSSSGPRINTLGSEEDSMKLKELMELCTKLPERVLDFG